MYWTRLSNAVSALEPKLGDRFIDDGSLRRIADIAERFPVQALDAFGFERRLGVADARVDIALALSGRGYEWLRRARPWPAVADIVERLPPHDPARMPRAWLEFDTSCSVRADSKPSVYVGLDTAGSPVDTLRDFARRLDPAGDNIAAAEHCLACLPASVQRVYYGKMLARDTRGLRLAASALRLRDIGPFLSGVGWPGDVAATVERLAPFRPVCARFGLQLDIRGELQPSLGVEFIFDEPVRREKTPVRTLRTLDTLVMLGWCSERERAALVQWPSRTAYDAPLIERLIAATQPDFERRLCYGAVVTALHHVKVTFAGGEPAATKAYFGAYLELT